MLRRLDREGPIGSVGPWKMLTIRSLIVRGLVKRGSSSKGMGRDGRASAARWFITALGARAIPDETEESTDELAGAGQ